MNHLLEQRCPQDPSTNLNNHLISKESLTMWTINIMKTGHKWEYKFQKEKPERRPRLKFETGN
jgi:hypothetical protein